MGKFQQWLEELANKNPNSQEVPVDIKSGNIMVSNPFLHTTPVGHKFEEQLTEADAENIEGDLTLEFSGAISYIHIYHGEVTLQAFVVNGLTLMVPANGERYEVGGAASTDVIIPAAVNCVVSRLV